MEFNVGDKFVNHRQTGTRVWERGQDNLWHWGQHTLTDEQVSEKATDSITDHVIPVVEPVVFQDGGSTSEGVFLVHAEPVVEPEPEEVDETEEVPKRHWWN